MSVLSGGGLGLGLGAMLRDCRTVQPLLLIICAGGFVASGGFTSVATLSRLVRQLNASWSPSYVFDSTY